MAPTKKERTRKAGAASPRIGRKPDSSPHTAGGKLKRDRSKKTVEQVSKEFRAREFGKLGGRGKKRETKGDAVAFKVSHPSRRNIDRAEQPVETAEEFPFMQGPGCWLRSAARRYWQSPAVQAE